jgi:hypothetical protein
MELGAQLKRQRIKHIVSSYQLDGNETEAFDQALELLLNHYPLPLIELALVETLVDGWLHMPLMRGCKFLAKAYEQLQTWENQTLQCDSSALLYISTISPEQFQQLTGLDPAPIYGSSLPVTQPPIRS